MSDDWYSIRSDRRAVRISGSDNLTFLQTKLTADTRRWRMTGGGYGIATDINGRVLFDGEFALSGSDVIAIFPADLFDAALEHIDRYVIMEDVECEAIDHPIFELPVAAESGLGLDPEREEPARVQTVELNGLSALAFRNAGSVASAARLVLIGPSDLASRLADNGLCERSLEALSTAEIVDGIPRVGRDFFVGKTIPLEAGLWNGVSLSKGCYLGQEILERLFSRGSAARRLVHFSVEGSAPDAESRVLSGDLEAGTITSSATSAAGTHGLAYIKRKFTDAPLQLPDGREVTRLGFVGGEWPEQP